MSYNDGKMNIQVTDLAARAKEDSWNVKLSKPLCRYLAHPRASYRDTLSMGLTVGLFKDGDSR